MLKKISLLVTLALVAGSAYAADAPKISATPAPLPAGLTIVKPEADGNVFFSDKAGKHAIDPVCGMQITLDPKAPSTKADGKTYYFCSDACEKKFAASPAEYTKKLALPAYVTSLNGGKMAVKCAVSGEDVKVDAKTPKAEYKGAEYYFCCDKCPKAFAKDPATYALGTATKGPGSKGGAKGMKMEMKGEKKEEMKMEGGSSHEGHKGH